MNKNYSWTHNGSSLVLSCECNTLILIFLIINCTWPHFDSFFITSVSNRDNDRGHILSLLDNSMFCALQYAFVYIITSAWTSSLLRFGVGKALYKLPKEKQTPTQLQNLLTTICPSCTELVGIINQYLIWLKNHSTR